MNENTYHARDPERYPDSLRPFVRILLDHEYDLSAGYQYYYVGSLRENLTTIATEMHDAACQLPEIKALMEAAFSIVLHASAPIRVNGEAQPVYPVSAQEIEALDTALAALEVSNE